MTYLEAINQRDTDFVKLPRFVRLKMLKHWGKTVNAQVTIEIKRDKSIRINIQDMSFENEIKALEYLKRIARTIVEKRDVTDK